MFENIDRSQLVKWVGYYLIIGGILTICSGVLLTGAGGLAGLVSVSGLGTSVIIEDPENPELNQELAAVSSELGALSALIVAAGIANIIVGPAMVIVAVGLLRKQSWARMGTIVVTAISLIVSLILAFGGTGAMQWAFILIDAVIIYLFYTDPRIKAELGG